MKLFSFWHKWMAKNIQKQITKVEDMQRQAQVALDAISYYESFGFAEEEPEYKQKMQAIFKNYHMVVHTRCSKELTNLYARLEKHQSRS